VLDLDGSSVVVGIALGPQGERLGLNETDVLLGIDGGERKDHIVRRHLANAHPNIGGDPVVLGVGGNDDDLVRLA